MIKKTMFFVALSALTMATSCSQDDLATNGSKIRVNPSMALPSRAVETTIFNLGSFKVTAFQDGQANYMNAVKYTSVNGSVMETSEGNFYWPVEGDLHFYAYAPDMPGQAGTLKLDKDTQALTDFVPNTSAANQKDFIYAKSTGNAKANGSTGIDIDFQHALSEITISAKNSNTAYTVEVTGVQIGNVVSKGTFTFPPTSGTSASWSLSNNTSDISSYTTTWTSPTALNYNVSALNVSNVPFMLIPQQLKKSSKASEKSYIAVKVKITMQGGNIIHDGWAYIGIDTNWEMGKKYAYILDFTNGAGQKEDGNSIISGTGINVNVTVVDWSASNNNVAM